MYTRRVQAFTFASDQSLGPSPGDQVVESRVHFRAPNVDFNQFLILSPYDQAFPILHAWYMFYIELRVCIVLPGGVSAHILSICFWNKDL